MATLDLDLLDEMNNDPVNTGVDLVEFIRFSMDLGNVAFMVLRYPGAVVRQGNYGYTTYSPEWVTYYTQQQCWKVDPAITLSFNRAAPFDWSEAPNSAELEAFWRAVDRYGIEKQGFTIPIHGPNQETCILSASAKHPVEKLNWWRAIRQKWVRDLLPAASLLQQRAFRELGIDDYQQPFISLSATKREVLYWAACGKSAEETAAIMSITVSTVRRHRENILKEMDCVNITQAVAEALQFGLISKPK